MTSDLDSRLRHAADALRRAPAEPPTHPPRPGHPLRVGALVVAVLALIVGAVALTRPDDGQEGSDLGGGDLTAQDAPRLLAAWLPEGYELASAGPSAAVALDPPPEMDVTLEPTYETYLFGEAGADDPYVQADLSVSLIFWPSDPSSTHSSGLLSSGQAVTVRGHAGTACRGGICGPSRESQVYWAETPDLDVHLTSRSLSVEQLVAIAEDMTIESDAVEIGSLPSEVPVPLDEMCRTGPAQPGDSAPPRFTTVFYEAPMDDGSQSHLSLSVELTEPEQETCALEPLPADEHPVEIRGHEGTVTTTEPWGDCATGSSCSDAMISLTWDEAPGVVVTLTEQADAISEDDLLRMAESLRPATDEEWAAAVREGEGLPYPVDYAAHIPVDAVASVNTDGMGSAAYLTADGRLCGFVVDVDGELPEVCGSADTRMLVLRNRDGALHTLFGRLPEGGREVAAMIDGRPDPIGYAFLEGQGDPSVAPRLYALAVGIVPGIAPSQLRFSVDGQVQDTIDVDEPLYLD